MRYKAITKNYIFTLESREYFMQFARVYNKCTQKWEGLCHNNETFNKFLKEYGLNPKDAQQIFENLYGYKPLEGKIWPEYKLNDKDAVRRIVEKFKLIQDYDQSTRFTITTKDSKWTLEVKDNYIELLCRTVGEQTDYHIHDTENMKLFFGELGINDYKKFLKGIAHAEDMGIWPSYYYIEEGFKIRDA